MDLYKISYDARRPEMDALTITKDSKFAIQFQFVKDEYDYFTVQSDPEMDRPVLHLKKADGTTTTLFTAKHGDDIVDGDGIYLWTMEEKFDSNVSCYIDYYQSYYNEETEEEWEKEITDCCICQINCKDSSIAYNAVSPTPYTEATSIRAGLNSKNGLNSVAIGKDANAGSESVAVGARTVAINTGIAVGDGSKSTEFFAIALGNEAEAKSRESIAIGKQAKIENNSPGRIQLGTGTIKEYSTTILQVNEFPLLDTNGKIPLKRIPDVAIGTEENPLRGLIFEDDNNSGKKYGIMILDGQLVVTEI